MYLGIKVEKGESGNETETFLIPGKIHNPAGLVETEIGTRGWSRGSK